MIPVFWYGWSAPISSTCVVGLTYDVTSYDVMASNNSVGTYVTSGPAHTSLGRVKRRTPAATYGPITR